MRRLISGTASAFRQIHGDPDHFRTGFGQLYALLRGGRRVGGVGHRHRLDDDRRAAADLDRAHADPDRSMESYHCHGYVDDNRCGRTPSLTVYSL